MDKEQKSLTGTAFAGDTLSPVFIEDEKMFDRIADITSKTAKRAYELFRSREADFGTQWDDWFRAESEFLRPTPVKVTETEDAIDISAEVPGFKPDEIEVGVKENLLVLTGESKSQEVQDDEKTFYSEWRSNHFCRQLILPSEVETQNVEAHLKDGILQMSFKKKAAEKVAKVAVKSA